MIGSWIIEVYCQGHESALHECSLTQREPNYSSRYAVAKCQAAAWGNLRFVSSTDANSTQKQSSLDHVEFLYCGNHHGNTVPAIEAEVNVPRLKFVSVRNCTSGGLTIHAPKTDVVVNNSAFVNAGKTGLSFLQTERHIVIENSESSRNELGIAIEEASTNNVPRVHYGRVFLCGEKLLVQNKTLLYFKLPQLNKKTVVGSCQKMLTISKGRGMKITLLYFKATAEYNTQLQISFDYWKTFVEKSTRDLPTLLHKELFVRHDVITVKWTGDLNSEVLIQVQDVNLTGEYSCRSALTEDFPASCYA